MRRRFSIACLLLAWLCANGAVWNAVQAVAWVKMFRDYSRVMPVAQALELTFRGDPCSLCNLAQGGAEAAREAQPAGALGASDRLVLAFQAAPVVVLAAPDFSWPRVTDESGLTRNELVPLPPPRV